MSLNVPGAPQRRRGAALEEALLDAAWAELTERGYDDMTIDAVAVRAGTSRAVLYRRWPGKQDLVLAALAHEVDKDVVVIPDTGSLRDDVVELLRQANKLRVGLVAALMTRLGGFYQQTGRSLADLRALIQGDRDAVLEQIIQRAIDRGEIEPEQVTERIARVPVELFRYEILMTLQPLSDDAIVEIVDTIFLPLLDWRKGR
ncbi:TetR family transcriptional regulator [Mycobacterium bohemicum DSM 44277]|jgi:AcrR family transcriptional regulator|uniref:TetR family transcriptional regulator n=1 Tax=Mycobacterium bohemicum DSM 44277 TaxID=1236609 RepID=A0A0U0W419_MYCBE|nr:TetR/AcrR family transcriptional regulator [Mycobacterium bohemicum]MCV6971845.1 TetR/AcrR family transcriptional regulator [Mycobacterium bohemicum]CPR03958.1 TetR family transcriptional regulator [Mycobacterium bohemicum DSM 44277]